jgi:hypothetical protein
MNDQERIVYLTAALKNLVLSADRYIDDGSWIEHLSLDVEFAKGVLKSTRIKKESKNESHTVAKT